MPSKSNRGVRAEGREQQQQRDRAILYDAVTARIIAELEEGRFPWVQPWGSGGAAGPCLPRNALTGRPYSGINILILWGAVIERGWPSQGWLTYRQAAEAGGCVRQGERGQTVVYADRFTPKHVGAEQGRAGQGGGEASEREGEGRSVWFLKRFTLFNVAQCDGLRSGFADDPEPVPEHAIVPLGEAMIAASGVNVRIGGDKAYYAPGPDFVAVPPQAAFFDPINFYRTCFHEITHATGHQARLGRDLTTAFGTKDYAREELIAEMGSAFLCAALGIVPTVRHADYLGAWLRLCSPCHKLNNREVLIM